MSAVAKTSWGTAATISAALASAPDMVAPGGRWQRRGECRSASSFGVWGHRGRVVGWKRGRASRRSRGGSPTPAVRQTEKPVQRQNRATLKGGIGAGRGGSADRARTTGGARDTTLPMVRDPIRAERDADVVSRTHGDGDGGRLLGELNTLHTRLGHDLHGAGLGGGAGGAGRGGGADGGDERNLGDSHFSWMCSCVYENGYRAVGPPVWIAILSGPCWWTDKLSSIN